MYLIPYVSLLAFILSGQVHVTSLFKDMLKLYQITFFPILSVLQLSFRNYQLKLSLYQLTYELTSYSNPFAIKDFSKLNRKCMSAGVLSSSSFTAGILEASSQILQQCVLVTRSSWLTEKNLGLKPLVY